MTVNKTYVIYKLNNILNSDSHQALEKVRLIISNSFDTEDEAIQFLIDQKKTYQDYLILREVFISEF
jgi:hypothetical protein